jgi:hypothetical protein
MRLHPITRQFRRRSNENTNAAIVAENARPSSVHALRGIVRSGMTVVLIPLGKLIFAPRNHAAIKFCRGRGKQKKEKEKDRKEERKERGGKGEKKAT